MKNKITIAFLVLLANGVAVAQGVQQSNTTNSKTKNSSTLTSGGAKTITKADKEKDINDLQKFEAKAKQAGITAENIKQLTQLVRNRAEEIINLTTQYINGTYYSVLEPEDRFNIKKKAIRNRYALLINKTITYPQFAFMMVEDFRDQGNENSRLEFTQLVRANPNLTVEQQTKIYDIIYNFHINELLTTAYLGFNEALLKSNLSSLRFDFEKKLTALCKEYNVKTDAGKGIDTNFQWND